MHSKIRATISDQTTRGDLTSDRLLTSDQLLTSLFHTFKSVSSLGEQGLVCTALTRDGDPVILKTTNDYNFVPRHEYAASQCLSGINFMRTYACLECIDTKPIHLACSTHSSDTTHTAEMDVDIEDTAGTEDAEDQFIGDVLVAEYIPGDKLSSLISSKRISENDLNSIIRQCLLAIAEAQYTHEFTHYDFHTSNILVVRNESPQTYTYNIRGEEYVLDACLHRAVIIDYGFSHSMSSSASGNEVVNQVVRDYSPYHFTNKGFFPSVYIPTTDVKTFFYTLVDDLKHHKTFSKKYVSELEKFVSAFLNCKSVDRESGWDKIAVSSPPTDRAVNMLTSNKKYRKLLIKLSDIIQPLYISGSAEPECKQRKQSTQVDRKIVDECIETLYDMSEMFYTEGLSLSQLAFEAVSKYTCSQRSVPLDDVSLEIIDLLKTIAAAYVPLLQTEVSKDLTKVLSNHSNFKVRNALETFNEFNSRFK